MSGLRTTPPDPELYEFMIVADSESDGWWFVWQRITTDGGPFETVARVYGSRRAEIVRDALSAEANEHV